MFSKNLPSLLSISAILFASIMVGVFRSPDRPKAAVVSNVQEKQTTKQEQVTESIPSIGRVQVLNGCGINGAADQMTDFLRKNKFNVANTGNASSWNYRFSLVVSHTKNKDIAQQIAVVLKTDRVIIMRKEDRDYDVTVITGHDYKEKMR